MTFKSKLAFGIGAAVAILLFVGGLSYAMMLRSRTDAAWVTHTYTVLENLQALQAAVLNAEASHRGLLLTRDPSYLKTFDAAATISSARLTEIRALTTDNPVQQRTLDSLEPLIRGTMAASRQTADHKPSGASTSGAPVPADELTLGNVTVLINSMEQEEHRLLDARTQQAENSTTAARHTIVLGNFLSLALLLFAGIIIRAEMTHRQRAEDRIREMNATLEKRVAERTADLERSNSELQQFAYVASHDLQEPLRMVASFTQLLAKRYNDKLGDDAREFIHYAVDGATRLQTLITDLLSYSRVGTQAKPFRRIGCDEALNRVLIGLKLAIQESRTTIVRDPLPVVMADETQLCQVLQNFLTNAMKFHGAQPPRIHISAERQGHFWRISVRDNGIGILPEHTERIWIIFQRLHTKAEYPGTGIGLAICKKIVERHGGTIGVEPAPGGGSVFYFTIPVCETPIDPEENIPDELRTVVAAH